MAQSKCGWPISPKEFLAGERSRAGPCFRDAGPGSKTKPSVPEVTIVLPHIPRPTILGGHRRCHAPSLYRTPPTGKGQYATKSNISSPYAAESWDGRGGSGGTDHPLSGKKQPWLALNAPPFWNEGKVGGHFRLLALPPKSLTNGLSGSLKNANH